MVDRFSNGMDNTDADDGQDLSRQLSQQILSEDGVPSSPFPDLISKTQSRDHEPPSQPMYGLLDDNGPSMFDENNTIDTSNPQSLSAAPVSVVQSIIDYHGAVELVQRLSAALAERDAHITALTRLAEEYKIPRERVVDTASRVKQAERRRLSLATASEDLVPPSAIGSDSGVCF